MPDQSQPGWFDRPANVNKIVYGLGAVSAFFALLDLVLHRESMFAFEAWPGFYALFGFVACVALVIAAKGLRKLLMRHEDYYD